MGFIHKDMQRNVKKAVSAFLSLALVFTVCSSAPNANAAPKIKKLKLNAKSKTLEVGQKLTLKVKKVTPSKASKSVTWKSSKKAVASVTKKGVVTAVSAGTAKITATSSKNKKVKATCTIKVKAAAANQNTPAATTPAQTVTSAPTATTPAAPVASAPVVTDPPAPIETETPGPKYTPNITLPEYALRDYEDDFKIGTVVNYEKTQNVNFTALAKQQFSVVSFENEMKNYSLLDTEASKAAVEQTGDDSTIVCRFERADEMVEWAKANNMKVRGHVLTWMGGSNDEYCRKGYDKANDYVDRETMLKRIKSYEEQVIDHFATKYPGTVIAWDVVNEAINADSPNDPDTGLNLGYSTFEQIIGGGGEYIKYAFQYAKAAVAKTGQSIDLFYNDFNTFESKKKACIIELINYLNEDEQLLDCMGMEGYIIPGWPSEAEFEKAMEDYAECGVKVGCNEVCFRLSDQYCADSKYNSDNSLKTGVHAGVTDKDIEDHVQRCKKMFSDAYIKFAKKYPGKLTNVSIWALLDRPDLEKITPDEHYDYSIYGTHSGLFTGMVNREDPTPDPDNPGKLLTSSENVAPDPNDMKAKDEFYAVIEALQDAYSK